MISTGKQIALTKGMKTQIFKITLFAMTSLTSAFAVATESAKDHEKSMVKCLNFIAENSENLKGKINLISKDGPVFSVDGYLMKQDNSRTIFSSEGFYYLPNKNITDANATLNESINNLDAMVDIVTAATTFQGGDEAQFQINKKSILSVCSKNTAIKQKLKDLGVELADDSIKSNRKNLSMR